MKSKLIRPPGLILKTGVMLLFAMTLAWLPQANASVTAGAVIENIATVDWEDADGNTYQDDAYTQVTVNLVEVAVTLSGVPTNVNTGTAEGTPIGQTVLTGSTATYLYAVTAAANGTGVYNFVTPNTGADGHGRDPGGDSNVTATPTVNWNLMAADGTTTVGGADPASVTLGSAIVESVPAANQLVFPGGSVGGFAVGDIVVVNGGDFEISAISANNAPDHGTTTTETQATITFIANSNRVGSAAPAFTVANVGDIAGEQQLFRVTVTATVNPATATGTVRHDIYLESATDSLDTQLQDTNTTFEPLPTVTITKLVRNVTAGGGFAATGTGDPGDILEYQVTISNSGSTAEAVVVTDPIPAYTTLQTFLPLPGVGNGYGVTSPGGGSGAATDVFAQVTDTNGAGTSVELTVQNSDDEDPTRASGDAAGTTAGSNLTFYVGGNSINGSAATTGGDVRDSGTNPSDVFVILYQVQIDN